MATPRQRREAQEIRDNAWLKDFFAVHRVQLLKTWEAAETTEERERLHARIRAVTDFNGELYAAAERIASE